MRWMLLVVPRRARRRWLGSVVAAGIAFGTTALAPGVAAAQQPCREGTPIYTDGCGPTFVVPTWGDAGGWTDASKFSTIQLADFNGDGRDELIGRNDQGLEIYWFDKSLGQWRPQVDAKGRPQVLTDFRSPLPNERPATDWTKPEYFATIQTAHINGNPKAQVLARFADGMRVYYFSPGPGGSINGGSWSLISQGGPFTDANGWNDLPRYSTIHTGDLDVSDPGKTELIGRSGSGLVGYKWNGSGWSTLGVKAGGADATFTDGECAYSPACYGLFRLARLGQGAGQTLVGRTFAGVQLERYDTSGGGAWNLQPGSAQLAPTPQDGVFADTGDSVDCPFPPGFSACIGSSPSYYEPFGAADLDGDKVDEVFARFFDGLRVKKLNPATGTWTALPTLTDLQGAASNENEVVNPALWASIRTADLDGDGRAEVLALQRGALQVWSYNPASQSWQQRQPSTPLVLTTNYFYTGASYYGTIQTGDVDGDGHDDVVARGPFGIRTWFYNRRGTGGWERYLAEGYPAFSGGQAAAFDALNNRYPTGDIRGVWTGGNTPDATTLQTLQTNLAGHLLGDCDPNSQTQLEPPAYGSCTPPAGISAGDWTPVVNEMLSEAYFAEQVVEHFGDLETIAQGLFDSESGALPAIAGDLKLAGAAGNGASFDIQGLFTGASALAASIASLVPGVGTEASAALAAASEVSSMLPSASATANSTFQTTYDGLVDKLATARDEMVNEALPAARQQVLGDQALLELVGQLRSSGAWTLDVDGMQSAGRQTFALQTYQALLPTMYRRYRVTNCTEQDDWYHSTKTICSLPAKGPHVITGKDGLSATWLGPPSSGICLGYGNPNTGLTTYNCDYDQVPGTMPDSVANIVWGAMPGDGSCNYQPPNKATVWTYGCPLGVATADGIGADTGGWAFTTHTGDPMISSLGSVRAVPGVVRASAARAGSSAAAARAGTSARASRNILRPLRFSGRLRLSEALRLRRMRVVVDRTLFEHGRREELARSGAGRRLRPFALRHVRDGFFTSRRRGRPLVRLQLRRLDVPGGARLDLSLSRVRTRDIRALCAVLPAGVSREGRRLELETRLRFRDAKATQRITLRQRWRCVRDRRGEFTGIRPVKPRRLAARRGLDVSVQAPLVVAPGRRATFLVTVANRRRARPSRVVSSLWNLRITGAAAGGRPRMIGLKQLRAGRSRLLRLSLRVPSSARRRTCLQVVASADSARADRWHRCVRIASTPRVTD